MDGVKVTQAVILAGGKGIRLQPYTYDRPKAIVEVNGKPFLGYLIEMLKSQGIEEVVMLLGYLPEKVQEYLGDGSSFGVKVTYSIGGLEDATAERIRNAAPLLSDRFLLLYCDNYLRIDLAKLVAFHESKKDALATMTVYTNEFGYTKNNLFIDQEGYVTKYDKTRTATDLNGIDTGFFIFEKRALDLLPMGNVWLDVDLFPRLLEKKALVGLCTNQFYYSLSNPERLKMTETLFGPQKNIFLDRDGVINKKMPRGEYVTSVKEFEFLPGAIEAISLLTKDGYTIYIISNQAGIGRGVMTESDLFEVNKHMEQEIEKAGGKITEVYYCPHKADDGCKCRKPKGGMFYRAALDHAIDLPRALFIGDDPRDGETGEGVGCKTIVITSDDGLLQVVKSLL